LVRRRLQGGGYGVPREEEDEEEVQTLAAMASSQNPVSLPAHAFERHHLFEICFCT
jgi:acyl-CoA synthetase (NDP forming)